MALPDTDTWRIEVPDASALDDVRTFAMQARTEMFGDRFERGPIPADLKDIPAVYGGSDGYLRIARREGEIVGTIGYRAYDHRFPQLDLRGARVVEVVKLYVRPDQRRQGLADRLFLGLEAYALANGIKTLYLHTHPYLPGAETFWTRHGFQVDVRDTDPVWQTIHMSRRLERT
ncbi:GNAT family N-acetyltransferase [Pseudomonas matsuisoli]|uniref:N-acetyltransferase n=1 Tax=Pseudomonas matsuisoli TaxID=1515666 RepID=A0A917Q2K1_9PSED|nr:GNAT family N-acetyltransferase [Pseudomonas matsuisoli]GGK08914.1 N-acetyltransferase [Pseudomonas matsuisoli]